MKRSSTLTAGVFIVSCLLFFVSFSSLQAQNEKPSQLGGFVENRGQWADDFSYRVQSGNISTWITNTGLVFDVRGANIKTGRKIDVPSKFRSMTESLIDEELTTHHAFRIDFVGAQTSTMIPSGTMVGTFNYMQGRDESKWVRNVPRYSAVTMKEVYPGVDALVTTVNNTPQYNFVVQPGADASAIQLNVDGATSVSTNASGELVIGTSCGEVHNGSIYAYQEVNGVKQQVACSFKVEGTRVHFEVANYNHRRALVIDPIVYGTYIGGDDLDIVTSSKVVEATGNYIVVGYTMSTNFPKTTGSYTSPASGAEDAFVVKFDTKLSKMLFCTYVGGTGSDKPWDVAIARSDNSNDIIVCGETSSANFPTKTGSYKQNQLGLIDAFVFRLLNNGTDLKYSTYFGGANGDDRAYSLTVSASNQVIFCGSTTSTNMATTSGVNYKTALGQMDGFLARLGATGGTLEYSLYYGGSGNDRCTAVGMSVSKDNIACVVGETSSGNLPLYPTKFTSPPPTTKILAPQQTMKGVTDCFFVQFNATASSTPNYSTYFGGNDADFPTSILVDNAGVVTLAGGTKSTNLNQILNYQTVKKPGQEVLLASIAADGQSFTMTSYFGGNGDDVALDFDTDDGTNLFIVGRTTSSDLPITEASAEQKSYNQGAGDGFVVKIGSYVNLRYCSYAGTAGGDSLTTICVLDKQNAYIGGVMSKGTMRTTDSVVQKNFGGLVDGFAAKWTFSSLAVNTPAQGDKKCSGQSMAVSWFASDAETDDKYLVEYSSDNGATWITSKKDNTTTSYNWVIPANAVGGANYRIRVTNELTGYSAMNPGPFTVQASPAIVSMSKDTTICKGLSVTLGITATGDALTYQWRKGGSAISGATGATYMISNATKADSASYDCVITGACTPAKTSSAVVVHVQPGPSITKQPSNVTVPHGGIAHFDVVASGSNLTYRWQFNDGDIPGATNASYQFTAQDPDVGSYRCVVNGDCGSDTSASVALTVSDGVIEEGEYDGILRIVSLTPNPSSDVARIRVESLHAGPVDYMIINEAGMVVVKGSGTEPASGMGAMYESTFSIPTSQLPQGAYKLMISSGDKRVFKNFVVQR